MDMHRHGNADVEITAETAEEAAQKYVAGGDWGNDTTSTWWVNITCMPLDESGEETDGEAETITIHHHCGPRGARLFCSGSRLVQPDRGRRRH